MNDNQPPCGIDDIIVQTFDFNNLKRYIAFIDTNSLKAFSQINEIKNKLLEIDDIKSNINEMTNRLDSFINKFDDVEKALNFQQMKILEIERKSQSQEEVF